MWHDQIIPYQKIDRVTLWCLKRDTGLSFGILTPVQAAQCSPIQPAEKVPNETPMSLFKHRRRRSQQNVNESHLARLGQPILSLRALV